MGIIRETNQQLSRTNRADPEYTNHLIQHDTFLNAVAITHKGTVHAVANGPFLIATADAAIWITFSIPEHTMLAASQKRSPVVICGRAIAGQHAISIIGAQSRGIG